MGDVSADRGLGRIAASAGLFLALVLGAHYALEHEAVWTSFRKPYCDWLARVSGGLLTLLGVEATTAGNVIDAEGLRLSIVRSCDALLAMAILAAALVAFPSAWRAKAIGLAVGLPLLFLVNLFRIVALALLGLQSSRLFEIVHVYVFQVFLIAATVGYFVGWSRMATTRKLAR
jgi:exosortase H (IPTLxxWG-CTERM-specific)